MTLDEAISEAYVLLERTKQIKRDNATGILGAEDATRELSEIEARLEVLSAVSQRHLVGLQS